jgi:hypothetical protein
MNVDEALRAYVSQPVPSGLEARVMRRVYKESSRVRWWVWMAPGLVAAGCLFAIWLRPVKIVGRPILTAAVYQTARSAGKPMGRAEILPHQQRRESGAHALWRFAQAHPEAAARLVAQYEPSPIMPLEIDPITIEELGNQ